MKLSFHTGLRSSSALNSSTAPQCLSKDPSSVQHKRPFRAESLTSRLTPWPQLPCESEVAQSCPTLCDPVDCSPPGSSIHGILQARILEWVAISFSRGSSLTQGSNPGIELRSPALQADALTSEPPGKPMTKIYYIKFHRNNLEKWKKNYACHGGLQVLNEETFLF